MVVITTIVIIAAMYAVDMDFGRFRDSRTQNHHSETGWMTGRVTAFSAREHRPYRPISWNSSSLGIRTEFVPCDLDQRPLVVGAVGTRRNSSIQF